MTNWRNFVVPLVVYTLGVLCGVGGTVIIGTRFVRQFIEQEPRVAVGAVSRMIQRRLDLTPAQRIELAPVFAAAERNFEQMRRQDMRRTHRIIEAAVVRIRPSLDPVQQRKLDRWLAGPRARWKAQGEAEPAALPGN